METKNVIYTLRTEHNMTQDALAEKVFVTRQAVSRWEKGETVPNSETLKLLSEVFQVSINTLLGSPRPLICQCCGMPLTDELIGRNHDGSLNEDYCKWCFADGTYTYDDMDDLMEVCVTQLAKQGFTEQQAREYMKNTLPQLNYWKNRAESATQETFKELKKQLISEINDLHIPDMPQLTALNALVGAYVNLAYPLPSGAGVKFLSDGTTYLGNQLESLTQSGRCFGVLANADFIMVSTYGQNGDDPELILYKKR